MKFRLICRVGGSGLPGLNRLRERMERRICARDGQALHAGIAHERGRSDGGLGYQTPGQKASKQNQTPDRTDRAHWPPSPSAVHICISRRRQRGPSKRERPAPAPTNERAAANHTCGMQTRFATATLRRRLAAPPPRHPGDHGSRKVSFEVEDDFSFTSHPPCRKM